VLKKFSAPVILITPHLHHANHKNDNTEPGAAAVAVTAALGLCLHFQIIIKNN